MGVPIQGVAAADPGSHGGSGHGGGNGHGNGSGNGPGKAVGRPASSATGGGSSGKKSSSTSVSRNTSSSGANNHNGSLTAPRAVGKPIVAVGDGRNGALRPAGPADVVVPVAVVGVNAAAPVQLVTISLDIQHHSPKPTDHLMLSTVTGGMAQAWADAETTELRSGWAAVIGLLLLPFAGLWLGYRQARAAREAEEIFGG